MVDTAVAESRLTNAQYQNSEITGFGFHYGQSLEDTFLHINTRLNLEDLCARLTAYGVTDELCMPVKVENEFLSPDITRYEFKILREDSLPKLQDVMNAFMNANELQVRERSSHK